MYSSTTRSGITGEGCFTAIILTIVGALLSAVFGGYVLSQLYNWFAVPIFEVSPIGISNAIGLSILINTFKPTPSTSKDTKINDNGDLIASVIAGFLQSALTYLIAWALGAIVVNFT
jgi:hypothetical protein